MSLAVPSERAPVLPRLRRPDAALIVNALKRDGCVVVHNALARPAVERIGEALEPWFANARNCEGLFFGRRTRRFSGLFAKAKETAELAIHSEILAAAEQFLLGPPDAPHGECIQLNLTQAIEIGPGEPHQLYHRDDSLFPFEKSFELMVNVMWPLDDFTAENGATRLAPGSHQWPRELNEQYEQGFVDAVARVGSAIIWTGALLHGGGANRTERARRGLVVSYSLAWLAPAEKLLLSTPPRIARELPERLQKLIGYQVHRPNLGWVEGRDPREWLQGDFNALAAASDNLTPLQEDLMGEYLTAVGRQ